MSPRQTGDMTTEDSTANDPITESATEPTNMAVDVKENDTNANDVDAKSQKEPMSTEPADTSIFINPTSNLEPAAVENSAPSMEERVPVITETKTNPAVVEEDLEDGELSDGEISDSPTAEQLSKPAVVESSSMETDTPVTSASGTGSEQTEMMPPPTFATDRTDRRKSSESSDPGQTGGDTAESSTAKPDTSDSSSSEDEDRSERKRKKREAKEKKKKERKKRKREKEREKEKKLAKRRKHHHDTAEDSYGEAPWLSGSGNGMMSPPGDRRYSSDRRYSEERSARYSSQERSPPGPYDSPPRDPYDSPPYADSSDDEYSQSLYSLVGDQMVDPTVSALERENMFSHQRGGLTLSKVKKIMKSRKYWEKMKQKEKDDRRRDDRRGARRGREREDRPKCRFYAEGKCQKADRCPYSHNFIPAKKMEACKFFLQGYCAKGDMCIYLHSEVPCRLYHTGQKCFNAEKCKFSHDPLTDSTRPLLEKAIRLEDTGTFKPDKPSLLGTPPKNKDIGIDFDRAQKEHNQSKFGGVAPSQSGSVLSIFDLDLKPSADLAKRLNDGLYEELTAPLSDSDNEKEPFSSPIHRPGSFYSDTLTSSAKSEGRSVSAAGDHDLAKTENKKSRWGPKAAKSGEIWNPPSKSDGETRKPLLPTPPAPSLATSNQSSVSTAPTTSVSQGSAVAQAAAANLIKILNDLRGGNAGTSTTPAARVDPRVMSDPRTAVSDPRAASDPRAPSSDPRKAELLLADPRAAKDPRGAAAITDPRRNSTSASSPLLGDPRSTYQNNIARSSPLSAETLARSIEVNGKPLKPMEYRLRPITITTTRVFIPQGAENNQELLRDPRIRKRIAALKTDDTPEAPPTLPDITADLQRLSKQLSNPGAKTEESLAPTQPSYDPRVGMGHGDHSSAGARLIDHSASNKPRNHTRSAISKVNTPIATEADDDDEEAGLTIDMSAT